MVHRLFTERCESSVSLLVTQELEHVNNLFINNKDHPPLSKNQPPLAGSINWSHSLFLRVRKTIAKFQQVCACTCCPNLALHDPALTLPSPPVSASRC